MYNSMIGCFTIKTYLTVSLAMVKFLKTYEDVSESALNLYNAYT